MLLRDRNVVITGAGSGVGRAAARLFAEQGANLICADINAEWAETSAQIARDLGRQTVAMRCDVSQKADVDAIVARAVTEFGRLDVIFNNVGIATSADGKSRQFIDQDDRDFDRLVNVNYRGTVYGCQAAVRQFLAQGGGGVIVNTASIAGIIGWGGVMYGTTKGAVVQLTRALAIEVAKHGIRINSVCPAGMMTNFGKTEGAGFAERSAEEIAKYSSMHPLGRPIAPEDCANAALFLASDMSANITGVLLPVDGGLSAG